MSFDGKAERAATKIRLLVLVGGRIHDFVPEESQLDVDADGLVLPYIVLSFGAFYPSASDRTIMGEEQQPQVMPTIVECWGPDANSVRNTAGEVRSLLVGWAPDSANATPFELRGGGWFPGRQDSSGRPTRSMESVSLATTLNQSVAV